MISRLNHLSFCGKDTQKVREITCKNTILYKLIQYIYIDLGGGNSKFFGIFTPNWKKTTNQVASKDGDATLPTLPGQEPKKLQQKKAINPRL